MIKSIKKSLFSILLLANFFFIISCEDGNDDDNYKPNYSASIDATNLPTENKPMTMFEDSENSSKM